MIWHYGYLQRTVQGNQDRLERSLRMLEAAVNEDPQNIYLNAKLAVIYFHLGEHSLAYTYAYRVLTEMDHSQLTIENLRDILRIVSNISIQRGHYDLAVQTAQACLDLSRDDTDALLSALDLLGVAYGAQAELFIKRAVAMEHQLVKMEEAHAKAALNEQRMEWLTQGKAAATHSENAFETLLAHPQLRISHKERVQHFLDQSRTLLHYIETRMAWQP
jgi:tetratricopeptide (TPR) repeat protein